MTVSPPGWCQQEVGLCLRLGQVLLGSSGLDELLLEQPAFYLNERCWWRLHPGREGSTGTSSQAKRRL